MTGLKRYLVALVALLAILLPAVGLEVTNGTDSQGQPTVTISLGGVHGTPPIHVTVPKSVYERTKAKLETGLRSEYPEGVKPSQLAKAQKQQEALAASDQLPIVFPGAAPTQRGCTTQLVQNYSSRRGVRPRVFTLHFTVSPNRPGWSDVDAVVGLFDRPAYAASSNYVMDNEGNCKYIVRETDKAWTQAAANPFSISVEMVNTGHEPTYAGTLGLQKLAMVASDSLKRWSIPLQKGVVTGCVIKTPGIIDHKSLGACGGGHTDISPYSVDQVIAAVKAFRASEAPAKRATYRVAIVGPDGKQRGIVYRDSPARYLSALNLSKSKIKSATVTRVVR